jgi:hypothetical protein
MITITTRQARQALFSITSDEADTLRRELFQIEAQDEPLPAEFASRFQSIVNA